VIERRAGQAELRNTRQITGSTGATCARPIGTTTARIRLLKTLTFQDYRCNDRFWRPHDMNMVNHQTGKSSQLVWFDYAFRTGLTENDFNQHNLTRIR
jgi:hypothetical protein